MSSSEVASRFIQQIYQVRPDLKLPKTAIHKLLFAVRAALPENNPEREHLPFYWYKFGPYSEVVESSIDLLRHQGVLRDGKTQTGKTLLMLNTRPAASGSVCEDASAVVGRVVREFDPYHLETFVDRIYRDHAPYEFMPRYRVEFLAPFKDYLASHPDGQRTLSRWCPSEEGAGTPDIDRLEDALYRCEAVLVEEPLFERFNDECTAYITGAGGAFDLARKDEPISYPVIKATYTCAWELWYTFASGIRILDGGHDRYYNGRLRQWEQEYRETLAALAPKVDAYTRYVRESARCLSPREPNRRTKRILSSLVEGYLSG